MKPDRPYSHFFTFIDQHLSDAAFPSTVKHPCSRGGEKGTHGVDESVQFNQQTGKTFHSLN